MSICRPKAIWPGRSLSGVHRHIRPRLWQPGRRGSRLTRRSTRIDGAKADFDVDVLIASRPTFQIEPNALWQHLADANLWSGRIVGLDINAGSGRKRRAEGHVGPPAPLARFESDANVSRERVAARRVAAPR